MILDNYNNLISVIGNAPANSQISNPVFVGTIGTSAAVLDGSWLVITPDCQKLVSQLTSSDSFLVFMPAVSQTVFPSLGSSGFNKSAVSVSVTNRDLFVKLGGVMPTGSLISVIDPSTLQACRCVGIQIPVNVLVPAGPTGPVPNV